MSSTSEVPGTLLCPWTEQREEPAPKDLPQMTPTGNGQYHMCRSLAGFIRRRLVVLALMPGRSGAEPRRRGYG